jgi:hypothetical protein
MSAGDSYINPNMEIGMKRAKGYQAIVILNRNALLSMIPPKYKNVVAHHVTLNFGVYDDAPLPTVESIVVIGHIAHDGIQAVIVALDGDNFSPDGRCYHITISHSDDRRPVESNDLLKKGGSSPLVNPFILNGKVTFIPFPNQPKGD